ncbi:hypothetical protein HaLaN_13175 [Haematococcus lacustris]|uniref:Uncharacterized protein n=1 Tax=Haematococcus lacustris TaxID=44745 RepID=A0A699Z573_HAELA|nr:hypothetical protein HaLaN_13175 [Haematococcus lacustris]
MLIRDEAGLAWPGLWEGMRRQPGSATMCDGKAVAAVKADWPPVGRFPLCAGRWWWVPETQEYVSRAPPFSCVCWSSWTPAHTAVGPPA